MSNLKMPPQSPPTLCLCLCSLLCAMNTASRSHDDNCTAQRSNESDNISLIRFSISQRELTLQLRRFQLFFPLFFFFFFFFCLTSTSNDVVFALRLPSKRMPPESISSTLSTFLTMIIQINNH